MPLQVPDRLARLRVVVGEEAAAVLLGEDAGEAPLVLRAARRRRGCRRPGGRPARRPRRAIGPLRTCTIGQSTSRMSFGLSSFLICPSVQSLHSIRNSSPGLTDDHRRNVGVPAVVARDLLLRHGLRQVDLEQCLRHLRSPLRRGFESDRQHPARPSRRRPRRGGSRARCGRARARAPGRRSPARSSTPARTRRSSGPGSRGSSSACRARSLMIDGWIPSVGSSSSSTFGLLASARAMASCCCCPPERLPPRRAAHLLEHREELEELRPARPPSSSAARSGCCPATVSVGKIIRPCGTYASPSATRS